MTGKRQASGFRLQASVGFTLIEVLIVVSLIVVLAGIGLATYSMSIRRSKESVLLEDLDKMRRAIDQYSADKGHYPFDLSELVADGYIRQVPKDPLTDSAGTWRVVMSDIDPSNPGSPPGVADVKSGAEGTGLDGKNYSDW